MEDLKAYARDMGVYFLNLTNPALPAISFVGNAAKDLTKGWWIDEHYTVKVNYRDGNWKRD